MGWRFVEDKSGLWAVCHIYPAAKIQKINSLRSLNCLKSRIYMKSIDLNVLLLHEKWANTMISLLKAAKEIYDRVADAGCLFLHFCFRHQ